MIKVKQIMEGHLIEFAENPASKLFGITLNIFIFSCSLAASIWLLRVAYSLVINAALR